MKKYYRDNVSASAVCNHKFREIVMVESDNNKRGDLFNRLVFDIFHALGFEKPQFNVPKTGREIDITLEHRTEKRCALVECKADKDKIGGSDINKFAGVLDLESAKYKKMGIQTVGYFVSQSGFTSTATEQEKERASERSYNKYELILLGPEEICNELVRGKVLCSKEKAIETASRYVSKSFGLCENIDLIACESGWIWVLYYSKEPKQGATHFTFVHADGNPLLNSIADSIIEKSKSVKVAFTGLQYIEDSSCVSNDKEAAQEAYFRYLENELGEIQFEGMPTDKEAGAVKVNLESIFVPLRFIKNNLKESEEFDILTPKEFTVNDILDKIVRTAILAKPGGGKSTLIRRIALAYAFPERRNKVEDGLPDRDFFPIYIRCRDLGDDAKKSIGEIMLSIVNRAEITQYKRAFEYLTQRALQEGRALLLIDGLDEISVEQNRISFVNQLRTFVSTYPNVHLLVTSREAGFRAVAGTLAGYCNQYSIASLNRNAIRRLCLKWHQAILGQSNQTEEEANKVCDIILNDSRIIALAENPLLLTTLLFVKRWVGYLPTKKCRLYEEMIKLLLVTWNAVAHERLDMDETEPQLAFVAYHMTMNGQQKITRDKLEKYVIEARNVMPEILSYTNISPSKFIDLVEERSSLLIQFGLEKNEKDKYVESYEFSHLSFQEYLTAKAIAEGWIPDADRDLLDIIKPHIREDHWKEVIPLVAVLCGRQIRPTLEYLIKASERQPSERNKKSDSTLMENYEALHLANCVASEVPMSTELLEKAIKSAIIHKRQIEYQSSRRIEKRFERHLNLFNTILKSKYGNTYCDVVKKYLFDYIDDENIYCFADCWIDICLTENENSIKLHNISECLKSKNLQERITGALLMMSWAFERYNKKFSLKNIDVILRGIYENIYNLLLTDDSTAQYAAAWSIAWSGYNETNLISLDLLPKIYERLLELWLIKDENTTLRRCISWALYSCCRVELRDSVVVNKTADETEAIKKAIDKSFYYPQKDFDRCAALHLGILFGVWSDNEKQIKIFVDSEQIHKKSTKFLIDCGYGKIMKRLSA